MERNSSLSGIEKAFTFSYDVTTPDGKRRWGKYSMNLPRVNTVPYLAKGAVIPPRSEFLVCSIYNEPVHRMVVPVCP